MKLRYFAFLVSIFLITSCGQKKQYPVLIEKEDLKEFIELGYIEDVTLQLNEGEMEHEAIFNLTEKGKKANYEKTGFHDNDIGFYKIIFRNPYKFKEFLKENGVSVGSYSVTK